MTPVDDMAFVGDPPLWRPKANEVHVSVSFTWDIEEGRRLAAAWSQYYPAVKLGGPAITGSNGEFMPGKYVKPGVVFTSRGCPNHCPWCLVPDSEGPLKLLDIKPGYIIQDNNFLATPEHHRREVYEMLKTQPKAAVFSGGLQSSLVTDRITKELRSIRIATVFLAADTDAALEPLQSAVDKLSFLGLHSNKLRCYVMIGYQGETLKRAKRRLESAWEIGCVPFAQLYQSPERYIRYPKEWKTLARTWSRPAAIRASHREVAG